MGMGWAGAGTPYFKTGIGPNPARLKRTGLVRVHGYPFFFLAQIETSIPPIPSPPTSSSTNSSTSTASMVSPTAATRA
ncbi:hypothetical protein ACFX19_033356 [Malus domestica]